MAITDSRDDLAHRPERRSQLECWQRGSESSVLSQPVAWVGEVDKAEDLRLDRTVALKFLPEALTADGKALRRLRDEAKAACEMQVTAR
jgi:hypothetical protein